MLQGKQKGRDNPSVRGRGNEEDGREGRRKHVKRGGREGSSEVEGCRSSRGRTGSGWVLEIGAGGWEERATGWEGRVQKTWRVGEGRTEIGNGEGGSGNGGVGEKVKRRACAEGDRRK